MGRFTAVAMEGFKALCVSRSQAWIVLLLRKGKRKGHPPVLSATVVCWLSCQASHHSVPKLKGENLKTTGFILYYKPSCATNMASSWWTCDGVFWSPSSVEHRAPEVDLWSCLMKLITYTLSCIRILLTEVKRARVAVIKQNIPLFQTFSNSAIGQVLTEMIKDH